MAAEKKVSFLKAQKKSPGLIWSEIGPMRFLKYCNYNYWAAAEALVEYWEKREELFGERAFLPLTLTGKGALTSEDVITVQTGKFAFLPETPSQQPVMFADRNRVLPTSTTESKLRAFFYMLQQLANAPVSQTKGCHVMVLLVTPRTSPLDVNFVRGALQLINTMPAKIFLHFLTCLPRYGMPTMIQQIVTTAVSYGMTNKEGFKVYTKAVGEPILKEIKDKIGLEPNGLPATIGGTWKYEKHTLWCRKQAAADHDIDAKMGPKKKAVRVAESASRKRCKLQPPNGTDDTRKRAKSQNVIHSRLKRERRKAEEEELRSNCDRLRADHDKLTKEQAFLEKLVHDAESLVQTIEGSDVTNNNNNILCGAVNAPARNASPLAVTPVEIPVHLTTDRKNFLHKAPEDNVARSYNPETTTETANKALSRQALFGNQGVADGAVSRMMKLPSQVDTLPGQSRDIQAPPNQSISNTAPTNDSTSLYKSILLILNQSSDVQRVILAALQDSIRRQESVGQPRPVPAQANPNVPNWAAAPADEFGHLSQLQPRDNAQLDLLSLLVQSQRR